MTYAPGGWIPPTDDDGDKVRAVLSEGEARMSADAARLWGTAFFGQRDGALGPSDVVVHSGPAERADVTGMPNLFAQSPRYRWRFIACGVAVTYRTDAAGLQLSGRVVQRRSTPLIALVQLVDESNRVVASVRAVPSETIRQMVITSTYNRIDDISRHVYPPGVCWCAPVAGPLAHVNEDGSPC